MRRVLPGARAIATAMRAMLSDEPRRSDAGRIADPAHHFIAERMPVSDPGLVQEEREGLKAWLGEQLGELLRAHHDRASRCLWP
jgi:aminopeptidase N